MPPRKSDANKVLAGAADDGTGTAAKDAGRDVVNIEDLNLPKSIVTRLAKGVLPPNTQIQGNAMLAMTKSATVFVNYLASHANEFAQRENRKTLAPQDVFRALDELEFPDFKPRLEAELAKFNEVQAEKRNNQKNKLAANKAQGKAGSPPPAGGEEGDLAEGESALERDGQPASKKARRENDGPSSGAKGKDQAGDETADENEEDDVEGEVDGDVDDDEDEEREGDETLDADEQLEDQEDVEAEDEALDNGEDSE